MQVHCKEWRNFKNLLRAMDMEELSQMGAWYTWTNNRKNSEVVFERLDRAFANKKWLNMLQKAKLRNLPIMRSRSYSH